MSQLVYQEIAQRLQAINNCAASGNTEWHTRHSERLSELVDVYMPHGAGIDSGTDLDEVSTPNKLIFVTWFHHMDEGGCYDGWTEHRVIVTPSLARGFDMRVTGRNRNGVKEYLADTFYEALMREIEA